MVAQVIINTNAINLNKPLDYNIPEELESDVRVGTRVFVELVNRVEEGFVIGIKQSSKLAKKDILKIEDNILTPQNIELATLMARRYFCNLSECIKLMLPAGDKTKALQKRTKSKTEDIAYLKKEADEISFDIEVGKIKGKKQILVLDFLKDNDGTSVLEIEQILNINRQPISKLEENGYIEIVKEKVERDIFKGRTIKKDKPLKLNKEQQKAFDKISKSNYKEFLIYGITGSGKTEIYLQLIKDKIEKGKTALMLVPEISLTPQMVDRFAARFGYENIAVLHSKLSIGERYDAWQKIKEGKVKIVIGVRSSIFAPILNLGIIIIDEEHDMSYKSDKSPKYNAKDIAKYIAKQNDIPLVLGSATPDITTYYKASLEISNAEVIKLTKRANNAKLPEVEIVDLRKELAEGNRSILSRSLYEKIRQNLEDKKQTILFLNRRGFSTFVMCRDCGHVMKCKRCNISLTYHKKDNRLKCHYCGYEINNVTICPECKSKNIKYFGTGTQKLEDIIKEEFPKATTIRMDIDTVSKKNSHEKILNKFKDEAIDILIGTQMVVKGHHFPKVTLVGVISADGSLNIEDFRSNERTFDILTQVAGRAGREELEGQVIVQTYDPENFAIECAKEQDYDRFYNTEIELRKQLKYPPFCDIILFGITSTNKLEIEEAANKVYKMLLKKTENRMEVFKPVPAPIDKIQGKYRWRIIAKGKLNSKILDTISYTLDEFYKMKYKKTVVSVDVNPNSML